MNENDNIGDVICVSTTAGVRPLPQPGESSSLPDAGLSPAEPDETAGWNVVTRGRAGTRAKTSAKRTQIGGRQPRQTSTNSFEAATAAAKKRKAEESTAEQIVQLKELVLLLRLIKSHDKQKATGKAQHEKLLAAADQQATDIKELRATVARQAAEIAKLTAAPRLTKTGTPTYSDAVRRTSSASSDSETTLVSEPDATKGPKNAGLKDNQLAITVNTTRVKKNKQDTAVMRDALNRSLRNFKVTEGIAIQCIRLRQTDSVDLVFSSEEDTVKARSHLRWLTTAMPDARMRGEQWYPVKCDGVAKNVVMDLDKDNSRTLRDAVLTEFKDQNSTKNVDCTAMKVNWLSKSHLKKRVGSLVTWLRHKVAAEHLLQRGTAVFGASGALCSEFVRLDNPDLCYNCNKYSHKQVNCSRPTQCGVCSGTHNTKKCNRSFYHKCPACGKVGHTVFDKKCRLHPRHHQVSDKIDETRKPVDQTRGRPRALACSQKSATVNDTSERPIFGPALPPEMQEERQRSREGGTDLTMTGT